MKLTKEQKRKNLILTLIQYITLLSFIVISPWRATGILLQIIEFSGIFLAVWAIFVMTGSKINIMPEPRNGAVLIKKGPYRYIRHPMYLSIILAITPLLISHFDLIKFIIVLVLYVNLYFKLRFEEGLLVEYFQGYDEYMKSTKRMIPFIW